MISCRVCRRYDPVFCKGHIKDELLELIRIYYKYCIENNIIANGTLYMNEITYFDLCEELGCNMYDRFTGNYGRIYGFNIKIDNCITPYTFEIGEGDNMNREYCKNDVDSLDAYRYFAEGFRGAGKSNKVLTPLPTRYIINDKAVILFWSDGDKTVVKRSKDDKNDPVKGFLWAYFIKHSKLSRTKANKYLRDLDKED